MLELIKWDNMLISNESFWHSFRKVKNRNCCWILKLSTILEKKSALVHIIIPEESFVFKRAMLHDKHLIQKKLTPAV